MRLATRMAACLALLAALLIATNIHQLRLVEKIHSVGRDIGAAKLDAARVSIRLLQGIEGLREFAAKSLLLGDQDYLQQWAAWEQAVWSDLRALQELDLAAVEVGHRESLLETWEAYEAVFAPALDNPGATSRPGLRGPVVLMGPFILPELDLALDSMRAITEALIAANDASVGQRAEESVLAVDRARRAAWLASGGSLVLAILLSLGLLAYTSGPLRRLTQGTREIADGNLDHRIEARGGGELSELARDFNAMAQKLRQVDELKKDFLSHVSHELKGPLAAVHETNLILLDRIPGPLNGKQAKLLELSQQSAARLSLMIGNLLDISRLDSGAMQYHFGTHDVVEITSDVLAELSSLRREKALQVHLDRMGTTMLTCDADRLREVIANLVGNAFKFSPPRGLVRVSWRAVEAPPATSPAVDNGSPRHRPPYLLLSVEDQGPGVPDDHKQGVFEKFHQVRPNVRMHGQGVGLGLAIARKIVDAHAGAIWVEDGERGGSRFLAVFPGAVALPRAGREPVRPPPAPLRFATARAAARSSVLGRLALLVLLPALVACGSMGSSSERSRPTITPPVTTVSSADPAAAGRTATRLSMQAILDNADGHLTRREFDDAAVAYQEVLDRRGADEWDASGAVRARATWGLVLTRSLRAQPDAERTLSLLRDLATSYPGTREGTQAVWIMGLLEEVGRLRAEGARHEEAIRVLNETVEQLKRIDLTRRPTTPPQNTPRTNP